MEQNSLTQSPVCRMDNSETPAFKAAAPKVPQDICTLPILETILTQEENHFGTHWHMLFIITND